MKFVILIHSNPQPWGHPTSDHTAEYQAQSDEKKQQLQAHWETVMHEAEANNEVIYASALGDPTASAIYTYDEAPVVTDGPYSESKEHLAGFFIIDVESQERARTLAECFSCPGDTVELRPVMMSGAGL